MGIRLLNTAASTLVTYTFRADGIGKSRCILLRPVRRMSETVMTRVLHQDSSRHMDTVDVEKDTRRSCLLRITVHTADWHGGAARQVRPGQAAGQRTARMASWPDGEEADCLGGNAAGSKAADSSGGRAAGWRRSGLVGAVRMARRADGEEAAWSGLFGWQVGRMAKQRPCRGCSGDKSAGWRRSGLEGAVRMARQPDGDEASRSGVGRSGVIVRVDDRQVSRAG